jgi:hypothetical protein
LLALALAEDMVKNCGGGLHLQVGGTDFMEQMAKLVDRSGDVRDVHVYEKALELIQIWGEVFRPRKQALPLFSDTLDALRAAGHRFPTFGQEAVAQYRGEMIENQRRLATGGAAGRSLGGPSSVRPGSAAGAGVAMSPQQQQQQLAMQRAQQQHQHDQQRMSRPPQQQQQQSIHQYQQPAPYGQQAQAPAAAARPAMTPEQMAAKLRKDLDMVRESTQVLSQVIAAASPGDDHSANEIMVELVAQCREMAPRLIRLISEDGERLPQDLMMELLERNDDVQRCLENHRKLLEGEAVDADTLARQIAAEGMQERDRRQANQDYMAATAAAVVASPVAQASVDLLDLMGPATTTPQPRQQQQQQQQPRRSLLEEDLASLNLGSPAPAAPNNNNNNTNSGMFMGFDPLQAQPQRQPALPPISSIPSNPFLAPTQPSPAHSSSATVDDDPFTALASRNAPSSSPQAAPAPQQQQQQPAPVPIDDFDAFLDARVGK